MIEFEQITGPSSRVTQWRLSRGGRQVAILAGHDEFGRPWFDVAEVVMRFSSTRWRWKQAAGFVSALAMAQELLTVAEGEE